MKLNWENYYASYHRPGEFDAIASTKIGFYQIHVGQTVSWRWWGNVTVGVSGESGEFMYCDDLEDGKYACQEHWDNLLAKLAG